MMRLILGAIVGLFALTSAFAQGGMAPGPGTVHSTGGGSVNWVKTDNPAIIAGTANPQSFASVNIGTASASRYVIICAGQTSNGPASALTLNSGSITATLAKESGGGGTNRASIWYANVPTGTTASVDVTSTVGFPGFFGIAVGVITTATPTPANTAAEAGGGFNNDPQVTTTSLTVPSGGIGVLCGVTNTVNGTPTYNNWTAEYNTTSTTNMQLLLGSLSASGTPSISGYAFTDFAIAAASWGP